MKRIYSLIILLLALIVASAVPSMLKADSVRAEVTAQEVTARQRAITIAREHGLVKSRPDQLVVKQATLADWFSIIGFEPSKDAAKFGLDPKQAIWIVAMKGAVDWKGPGRKGGEGDKFDNITVALSIDKLEQIGTFTAGPDSPIPLGLQR